MPPTPVERRAHYDDFVAQVIRLCEINSIRTDLVSGRGRPIEDCPRMPEHLDHRIAGFGAARAHYTVASLLAMQRDLPHEDGPYLPETALPDSSTADQHTDTTGHAQQTPPTTGTATGREHAARAWRTRPNLGTSLAIAAARHGFDPTRMTGKVKTLTRLGTPLLHPALFSLAAHLHAKDAARLDFAVLLEDLTWWEYDRKHIAARWRNSYFITLHTLTQEH
ncbi:type I-E CRISPR-associated protein Cse2/CasB [Streptomyces sp. CWNU-52B]|uniref:type I-E CRISPR-associated protein Cse2/CasB n=1 Tax=unclassified Streptomyces TaxID=2593676 RepID=UPI0039BF44B9